jgi:hypothetical protein
VGTGHRPTCADARPFEEERRLRDLPAVSLATDQIGIVDDSVVEEDSLKIAVRSPHAAAGSSPRLVEPERNHEMPAASTIESVRANNIPKSDSIACELQTFCPEMIQRSPSRVAASSVRRDRSPRRAHWRADTTPRS